MLELEASVGDSRLLLTFHILMRSELSSKTLAQLWKRRQLLLGASRDGRAPTFFAGQRPQQWQDVNWHMLSLFFSLFFGCFCIPGYAFPLSYMRELSLVIVPSVDDIQHKV